MCKRARRIFRIKLCIIISILFQTTGSTTERSNDCQIIKKVCVRTIESIVNAASTLLATLEIMVSTA